MKDNKQTVIIVLLIANLILAIFFGTSIKNRVNDTEAMVNSQLAGINSVVSSLDSRITSSIQSILDERADGIVRASYQYESIDADAKQAVLAFDVTLKSVGGGSQVILACRPADGGAVRETELTRREGLNYGASIPMDMNRNYTYDIIERTADAGESILNIQPLSVNLYREFYENRIQWHSGGSSHGQQDMSIDFSFSVDDFGLENYGLDQAVMEILFNNEVIDTIDITGSLLSGSDSELIQQYNMAVASGEINENTGVEEFKQMIGEQAESEGSRHYYFYQHEIVYDTDYPDLQLTMDKAGNLEFRLSITCRDEYRYETEIYH